MHWVVSPAASSSWTLPPQFVQVKSDPGHAQRLVPWIYCNLACSAQAEISRCSMSSPRQQAVEDVLEAEKAPPRLYCPLMEKKEHSRSTLQSVQTGDAGQQPDVGATTAKVGTCGFTKKHENHGCLEDLLLRFTQPQVQTSNALVLRGCQQVQKKHV